MQTAQVKHGNGRVDPVETVTPVTPPVRSQSRQQRSKTPKSMKVPTVEQQAGKVVLSEAELDVAAVVASVITNKASMGQSFSGRKDGQHINAKVASVIKVKMGMEANQHLSDKLWKSIQLATVTFLNSKLDEAVKLYPEIVSIRTNVPTAKIDTKNLTVHDFLWQSRVARGRKAASLGDQKVGINELLRAAAKRLNSMLGFNEDGKPKTASNNAKTYTREEIDTQRARVKALEKHVASLTKEIDGLTGRRKAKSK